MGSPVDSRQATKKTASGLAHRHALTRGVDSTVVDGVKGLFYDTSSSLFQAYFLNRSHLQAINWLTLEPTPAMDNDAVQTRGWGNPTKGGTGSPISQLKLFLCKVLSISQTYHFINVNDCTQN